MFRFGTTDKVNALNAAATLILEIPAGTNVLGDAPYGQVMAGPAPTKPHPSLDTLRMPEPHVLKDHNNPERFERIGTSRPLNGANTAIQNSCRPLRGCRSCWTGSTLVLIAKHRCLLLLEPALRVEPTQELLRAEVIPQQHALAAYRGKVPGRQSIEALQVARQLRG